MNLGPVEPSDRAEAAKRGPELGQLPEIAAVVGLGLVLIALGDTLARSDVGLADLFFWGGIVAIVGPIGWRLLRTEASAAERLGLVVLMGMALYVVKMLHSPIGFTLVDEILHVRTSNDIMLLSRLFERNPLLLVSPLYPGLEIVTDLMRRFTGNSVFEVGVVIDGAARLLLVVGLFLVYERAGGSARIAGIATFVYMANPNFVLFDAQFAYETLALGLTAVVFHLTADSDGRWRSGGAAALVVVAAIIATHHVTIYAVIAFLVLWTVAWRLFRRSSDGPPGPGWIAFAAIVGAGLWLVLVAFETLRYLAPRVVDALELLRLLIGQATTRELFVTQAGELAPAWERAAGYLAVILLLAALPFGLWRVWREFRDQPAAVALGLSALAYPASLGLRLTQRGAEESTRTPEFVFLGVGFVVALAVTMRWRTSPSWGRWVFRLAAPAAIVIFAGGLVIGVPRWARLPGPYLPAADTRSIEPEGIRAAEWAARELGPGNRIVADRTNRILMGSYGQQNPVTEYGDGIKTWSLFYSPEFGPADKAILEAGRIDYLVIDLRLAGVHPLTRVYFELGEPLKVARDAGLNISNLTKFQRVPGVNVVFDSGNIRIYDVRALSAARALTP